MQTVNKTVLRVTAQGAAKIIETAEGLDEFRQILTAVAYAGF